MDIEYIRNAIVMLAVKTKTTTRSKSCKKSRFPKKTALLFGAGEIIGTEKPQ